MPKEYFEIEFNFPVQPEGIWTTFTARVEENAAKGTFTISHFHAAGNRGQFPVDTILLCRSSEGWVEEGQERENLMTALIGHAIEGKYGPKM